MPTLYRMHFEIEEEKVGYFLTTLTRAGAQGVGFELVENVSIKDGREGRVSEIEEVIVAELRRQGGRARANQLRTALLAAGFPPKSLLKHIRAASTTSQVFRREGGVYMLNATLSGTRAVQRSYPLVEGDPVMERLRKAVQRMDRAKKAARPAKKAAKKMTKKAAKKRASNARIRYDVPAKDVILGMLKKGEPVAVKKIADFFEHQGRGKSSASSMITQMISQGHIKRAGDGAVVLKRKPVANGAAEHAGA